MHVALCGRVQVRGAQGTVVIGRPQVQLCLALLVLERHRAVGREELAHVIWGDELGAHWQGALRGVLSKLRVALDQAGFAADALSTEHGMVQLRLPEEVAVDTEVARRRLNEGDAAMAAGHLAEAADRAAEAAELLRGGFLVSVDRPWADARRLELGRVASAALRLGGTALLEVDPSRAVELLERVVADDPFDEADLALLLRALVAAGERHTAVAVYDDHVRLLHDELGVAPSSALRRLGGQLSGAARGADLAARSPRREVGTRPARPPFVGRQEASARLRALGTRRRAGPGIDVALVEGEAGVGKTRLAREAALEHTLDGGAVLWGRCSAHGAVPFEPVVAALERAFEERPDLLEELGDAVPVLASILPSLGGPVAESGPDRGRLFAAVVAAVRGLADRPLLWVVDDLQWATPDTLALVEHVALGLDGLPVVLVATSRARPAPVAAVLESLGRHGSLEAIALTGISTEAVARWLSEAGVEGADGIAGEVQRRTGGNPLFVGHLIDDAVARGGVLDPAAVPSALAVLLAQRLDALPPDDELLLASVAVAGDRATIEIVGEVSGLDGMALLSACDRVVAGGLLRESGDRLGFGHALVADAVLDHLGEARRAWLHARAASVLAARTPQRGLAADLARHHAGAGPDHRLEARRWALVAAQEALDQVAWSVAADHARLVLDEPAADPEERAGALVVLGRALRGTGDGAAAEAVLGQAVALARLHRSPRRMAEATLALVGGGGRGAADPARSRWVPLLEEALDGLPDTGADELRAQLLGALTVALLLTDRDDDRKRSGARALDAARRSRDRALTARTLLDHRYCLSAVEGDQRVAEVHEALALADAAGLPEVTAAALVYLHEEHLVAGRRDDARAALDRAAGHLALHPDAYWSWALATWRVVDLLLDGDLERAEAVAADAASTAPDPAVGMACFGVNLVAVRAFQGRIDEMVEMLQQATEDTPWIPCYRSVLAFALAEVGRTEDAARELAWFAADGFRSVRDDTNRALTLAMLAEVTVRLGDAAAAATLRPLVEPYDRRYVVLNCFGGGGTVWGPASAQLAGLDRLLGDATAAQGFDARALEECRAMGDRSYAGRLGVALA